MGENTPRNEQPKRSTRDNEQDQTPDNSVNSGPDVPTSKPTGSTESDTRKKNGSGKQKGQERSALEDKALDAGVNMVPGGGTYNSARQALRERNAAKNKNGGEEDIGDRLEDLDNKLRDKAVKSVKRQAAMSAGTGAGAGFMVAAGIMKAVALVKAFAGMAMAALGKIGAFFAGIANFMISAVSTVLSVGAVAASIIIAVTGGGIVALAVAVVVTVAGSFQKVDDSTICIPNKTEVAEHAVDYVVEGEHDLIRADIAVKLWSVFSAMGGTMEQTAAVLGNFTSESQMDPTAIETIYTEPFSIGVRKQHAISVDFKVEQISASYAARFPAINYVGIGLAQWTNGRNRLLIKYAADRGIPWYDFDTQVKFLLEGDDPFRVNQFNNFIRASTSNVAEETERFMNTWIGLSTRGDTHHLVNRQQAAMRYLVIIMDSDRDEVYANSILNSLNIEAAAGNHATGAYYEDDGCGEYVAAHYSNKAVSGTGQLPDGVPVRGIWSRETLPAALGPYTADPTRAGLQWGNPTGWASNIYPGQCVGFAASYFLQLYPDWNQGGRPTSRPTGNGIDQAPRWAAHYGQSVSRVPSEGAIFSYDSGSQYGHTGIVQHVFANGDLIIVEQNVIGYSGDVNNMQYSWSWRHVPSATYNSPSAPWVFFRPAGATPQWVKTR